MLKDERQPDMSRFSSKALKPFGNFEGMCKIPEKPSAPDGTDDG